VPRLASGADDLCGAVYVRSCRLLDSVEAFFPTFVPAASRSIARIAGVAGGDVPRGGVPAEDNYQQMEPPDMRGFICWLPTIWNIVGPLRATP